MRGRSLLFRLMLVIMVTVSLTLVFTALLLSINERRTFRNVGAFSIETLAELVGRNSTATLAFGDKNAATDILNALSAQPEIVLGCLYAKNGALFASYDPKGNGRACPVSVIPSGQFFGNGTLSVSRPVMYENEVLGSLYLLSDMHIFRNVMWTYTKVMVAVILCSGIFAYIVASRLQHMVTGPVLQLAETARLISRQERYDLRASKSNTEEIDALVTSFNRMLDVIQKNTEMLRESEEQFRATFDVAAVGKALIQTTGKYIRVNSEFCRMLGYSHEEMSNLSVSALTHPEDREKSNEIFDKIVRGEIDTYILEKRYLRKDGTPLWATVSAAPIRDSSGSVVALTSVIQNITERKRAERERDALLEREHEGRLDAERTTRMRDDFLSIASHELRTPITPIKLHMQMMKRQIERLPVNSIPGQQALLKSVSLSERENDHLSHLIDDLLDVTRISAGRLMINRSKVDLVDLIHEALELLRPEFTKARAPVSLHVRSPKIIGHWDPDRIRQIVFNLLTNAIKYGSQKPIEVEVSEVDRKALLSVRDYGIGIAKENQEKIFDRFERVAPITSYGGLGLGLFISKEIAISHAGMIHVKSELQQGSTFTLELPLDFS